MLSGLSLDQLRIFVTAADEASFSAAGRRLDRAQSAISHAIANLEIQLGVVLFDRSERRPRLTPAGASLLSTARDVVQGADALRCQASQIAGGQEAELSVVIDVMFPQERLTAAIRALAQEFPSTSLRLYVEALGAVAEAVIERRCSVGVIGTLPEAPPSLAAERLLAVPMVTVVAPGHPLAALPGPIPAAVTRAHVQLVLTDRSSLTAGQDLGVVGKQTWRLADLGAKHLFLREGLGWGHMPAQLVADDLASGELVRIEVEGFSEPMAIPMSAVFRKDAPPGRIGRWFIDRLREKA